MRPLKLCTPNVVEEVQSGDTWRGFTVKVTLDVDVAEALSPLVSATLVFRQAISKRLVHTLTTDDSSLFIEDAATWRLSVCQQILPMGPGEYVWELDTVDANAIKRSPLSGVLHVC